MTYCTPNVGDVLNIKRAKLVFISGLFLVGFVFECSFFKLLSFIHFIQRTCFHVHLKQNTLQFISIQRLYSIINN